MPLFHVEGGRTLSGTIRPAGNKNAALPCIAATLLAAEPVTLENPYANTFLALNEGRGLDVRWAWEGLLDGAPDGYTLMQNGALGVISGDLTAQEAADALQEGLAQWFEPAQTCGE